MHKPDENQQRCLRTWLEDTRPLTEHMTHAAMGLSSEVGEFVGLVDKQAFKPTKQVTRRMMLDELGDVLYYVTIAAHLLGVTVDELYRLNAEKLAGGHGWVNLKIPAKCEFCGYYPVEVLPDGKEVINCCERGDAKYAPLLQRAVE
jgi:NTP pyrophosphatase (non-canonical NTP hydrolase)